MVFKDAKPVAPALRTPHHSTPARFFCTILLMNNDLKNKTLEELEDMVDSFGQKKYLARYIFSFIHSKDTQEISDITPLSKPFRTILAEKGCYISHLKTLSKLSDADQTVKYLFQLTDGVKIESVLMPDGKRKTLCVSTQAGCSRNCAFCATARLKLVRNLTAAEIVDQVNLVQKEKGRITNVVYMGMGEPLDNYDNVLKSVRILNHPQGKNIGLRRLTISTCGNADAIKKLAGETIHPRLAVSLNAPTDQLRSQIMPVNKKFPISPLMDAVKYYRLRTKLRVTLEYVLLSGLNDSQLCAHSLARLAQQAKCNINLIEYNPNQFCTFAPSGRKTIEKFARLLEDAGIETTVRFKRGGRINAACGQLGADLIINPPEK